MIKLAILATHPIQYYAPVFRMLAASPALSIKVFYTRGEQPKAFDKGFGKHIEWDIPLLEGYEYSFMKNTAQDPGTHHFRGIVNPDLIREVTVWGASALLVFGWSNQSHLKALRHFKGKIPIYFRGDSHLLNEKPGLKRILRRNFLRWVYTHVNGAFYVGSNNRDYYLKHGLKDGQLIFAPHAIDNERFSDSDRKYEAEAQAWRESLGIDSDKKIVLFCGKFEATKDPLLLMQVAKQMTNREDRVFLFVGNGPLEERIKKEAVNLRNVRFLDFQNQSRMPVVYRLANIFVLPSRGETWGLAVNEAMVCGLPVIVSDKVGCAVDLVQAGTNGYIFESNHLADLSEKLEYMLEDKKKLAEMGKQSAALIHTWNFERIVGAITEQVEAS